MPQGRTEPPPYSSSSSLPPQDDARATAMQPVPSLQTTFQSATRWLQIGMFAVFIVALILATVSDYENLSPGLIWGAILSLLSVFFVIMSYASVKGYRQHPNPLVFWRTIADLIFVLQLLAQQFVRCLFFDCVPLCSNENYVCGCSVDPKAGRTCDAFAGLFEFSLIAAECWFLCMTVDLLVSLTNPFTDFKRNNRFFHLGSWGVAIFMAILLASTDDWAGYSDLQVCWTNALRDLTRDDKDSCESNQTVISNFAEDEYKAVNANLVSWVFFYIWMGLFILAGIVVWIWAWRRLSEGMPETYAVRVQSIHRARFNVLAVTTYWIIVAIIYFNFLGRDKTNPDAPSSELLNFVIAAKGYVDLVIWFALNEFKLSHFTKCFSSESEKQADVDLNPQVNAALRREVLFYTTSGIIQAVQAAERLPASQRVQHLALLPQSKSDAVPENRGRVVGGLTSTQIESNEYPDPQAVNSNTAAFDNTQRVTKDSGERTKTFHDYEPHAFKKIRERFGVNNDAYLKSLSATAKERVSEGASGAFMFFSADGSLIVKSTSREEASFLRSIANEYADYLCNNPTTLMTRFYGCHGLELYGKQFSFIVMANLFDTDQVIHWRYDIKGSWVNRHGDLPKRGKKVTCRHCNHKYIFQDASSPENINCPMRLGGHEANVVLKDSDLTQKLNLDRDTAIDTYRQLCADSDLLCSFGIMDYSLLMGIHEVEYVVDENAEEDESEELKNSRVKGSKEASPPGQADRPSAIYAPSERTNLARSKGPGPGNLRHHASVSSNSNHAASSNKLNSSTGFTDTTMRKQSNRMNLSASTGMNMRNDIRTTSSVSSSGRRLPRSGMRMANSVVGPAYYHVGIIDILQTWTFQKRLERFVKITFKGADGDGLSAIEPRLYNARFKRKMADILGVDDLVDDGLDQFTQQNSHMDVDMQAAPAESIHVQSVRSIANSDQFRHLSSMDGHYADYLNAGVGIRQRGASAVEQGQRASQATEEYAGIDYHL